MDSIECIRCNAKNHFSFKFCVKCGLSLEPSKRSFKSDNSNAQNELSSDFVPSEQNEMPVTGADELPPEIKKKVPEYQKKLEATEIKPVKIDQIPRLKNSVITSKADNGDDSELKIKPVTPPKFDADEFKEAFDGEETLTNGEVIEGGDAVGGTEAVGSVEAADDESWIDSMPDIDEDLFPTTTSSEKSGAQKVSADTVDFADSVDSDDSADSENSQPRVIIAEDVKQKPKKLSLNYDPIGNEHGDSYNGGSYDEGEPEESGVVYTPSFLKSSSGNHLLGEEDKCFFYCQNCHYNVQVEVDEDTGTLCPECDHEMDILFTCDNCGEFLSLTKDEVLQIHGTKVLCPSCNEAYIRNVTLNDLM